MSNNVSTIDPIVKFVALLIAGLLLVTLGVAVLAVLV